jgi:hypothetical protein
MRGIKFPIVSEYNPKGFKQATKGVSHFKKSLGGLKGVLGGLGLALGAGQLASFGMAAAKAASAHMKIQQLLVATQKKSAHATDAQTKKSEAFVQTLSNQVGVLDDDLRPSLANLTRSTGSVGKAQKLLKIALNASAASGKPLTATVAAVSKAFHGQTGSLTKLFPELKNSKDALKALDDQTRGMAAIKADPFGKFTVATDNLKESLGALILPKLTDFMNTLMAPGGSVDQLGQFLKDAGNPKTDAGKAFRDIGDSMKTAVDGVNKFFAAFDPKTHSGVQGFLNVASAVGGAVGFAGDVAGFLGNAWNMAVAPGNMAADATKNLFKGKPKNNQTASYSGGSGGLGGAGGGGGGINGITVNVYGKATKTDAEEVIRLVREHERRNGTAWRK